MNASCSMFSQILKLIPRTDFESIVRATGAQMRAKGFSSWSQFVAMLFCQIGRMHSLLETVGALKTCEGKLRILRSKRRHVRRFRMPIRTGRG